MAQRPRKFYATRSLDSPRSLLSSALTFSIGKKIHGWVRNARRTPARHYRRAGSGKTARGYDKALQTIMKFAIATCFNIPEPDVDEDLTLSAFERRGHEVHLAAWEDQSIDWSDFDVVIIRSTWNYPLQEIGRAHV